MRRRATGFMIFLFPIPKSAYYNGFRLRTWMDDTQHNPLGPRRGGFEQRRNMPPRPNKPEPINNLEAGSGTGGEGEPTCDYTGRRSSSRRSREGKSATLRDRRRERRLLLEEASGARRQQKQTLLSKLYAPGYGAEDVSWTLADGEGLLQDP